MPRPAKTEVSAINIRIPSEKDRDYAALLLAILKLKRGIQVYGDTFIALSSFNEATNIGAFSKYNQIDIDGDWFDIEDFAPADPEKLGEIKIPENLRPNYSSFMFELNPDLHIIAFETYADSRSLSTKSLSKYFREIIRVPEIVNRFGTIEADIVNSFGEVERILDLPDLKALRLVIRRPNPDDISGNLAEIIEKRLAEQRAEQYEEVLKSKDGDGLAPNDRTKSLAKVAAENGEVVAKSLVNGVLVNHDTRETPLKKSDTYQREDRNMDVVFRELAQEIFEIIRANRKEIQQGRDR